MAEDSSHHAPQALYQDGRKNFPSDSKPGHIAPRRLSVSSMVVSDEVNNQGSKYINRMKADESESLPVPRQLPSPSPSPSPRSSTPSDFVSGDPTEDSHDLTKPLYLHPDSFQQPNLPTTTMEQGLLDAPKPISKALPTLTLDDIPEERASTRRRSSTAKSTNDDKVLKLSPAEMEALTSSPESLPIPAIALSTSPSSSLLPSPLIGQSGFKNEVAMGMDNVHELRDRANSSGATCLLGSDRFHGTTTGASRPGHGLRAASNPITTRYDPGWAGSRQPSPSGRPANGGIRLEPIDVGKGVGKPVAGKAGRSASESEADTLPQALPLPPMSLPTYLQLELASSRPSPLYIYRSTSSDYPYESSSIKFERLLNFLILPPQLEQVLWFGALACLDAWLSTFTILPLRFFKAILILIQWWFQVLNREARFISGFIYHGSGRMWHRSRGRSMSLDSTSASRDTSRPSRPSMSTKHSYATSSRIPEGSNSTSAVVNGATEKLRFVAERKSRSGWGRRHRRTKSQPSTLSYYHKADLLTGLVVIVSSMILMTLDASRMYHSIRGQSAMKLYVLYNLLEVVDRLLAALGQDIFECLTSDETLNRGADGRSKILRPFGMFLLALVYNVIHAAALFYQVITLNVAVNSYSNALVTLLMSNQFVEIKSTVFKKFEKENLFQLTCADVVERFQLWLMLVIIGLRNIVEVGGLSAAISPHAAAETLRNSTSPLRSGSMLPNSFTILPVWTGEVLSPFLIVLGSEMLVDWIKHAYISKFNGVKPVVYQKYLDVLAKDYYTNAFVNQNLIKRLGLPVIPLSCLFVRASIQTYHMFLATHLPPPLPSIATALSVDPTIEAAPTAAAAALEHFDNIIRMALGRSTFGVGADGSPRAWYSIGSDDVIASLAFILFFLLVYLVALICKLILGMMLLRFARNRYRTMKERDKLSIDTKGKRLGGWGTIEVDDEKRRRIYDDDPEGMQALRERERKMAEKEKAAERKGVDFDKVHRYTMAAKRIW